MSRPRSAVVLAASAVAVLSACGAAPSVPTDGPSGTRSSTLYLRVTSGSLAASAPLPRPARKPVLTLTGRIGRTNEGRSLALDMPTLEALGLVEYRMADPEAEGREPLFRGVLLADVLAMAGVPADAKTLHAVALNDYAVDLPVSAVRSMPVMLATTVDGRRMGVERFGPVRVVYAIAQLALDRSVYDARLIWQLSTIEVR